MSLNASGLSICFKDSSQSGFSGEAQLRLISRDTVAFVRKSQTVSWKMVKQIRTVFEAIFKAAEAAGIFFLGYSSLRPYFKYLGQMSIHIRNQICSALLIAKQKFRTKPCPLPIARVRSAS